ncbi:MAG: 6-pyruvoyl-tetrahydropterin synthase-related protein, partial [Anaeromyxobacteraceae bacterium]
MTSLDTGAGTVGPSGRSVAGTERRELWIALALLGLLSAVCCSPLFGGGWYSNHELIRPIARALAAYHEVAAGDLYPRWVTTAYLGKGAPLFNFYSPAFSLLPAYAHALGLPLLLALKLEIFVLFAVGATGVYLWVRRHLGHFGGLVASILYLFAPYHFVDVYVRGATAEFAALAPLGFLFWAIDELLERFSVRGLATLGLASAGIVLSHFLGALMIAPFAAAYALARAGVRRVGWAALGRVTMGAILGAALCAFYWLPALAEVNALSAERLRTNNTGYLSPYLHFVHPSQWFDTSWGFGGSVPDPYVDEMSFQVGALILVAVIASVLLSWHLERTGRRFVLLSVALGCGALWLTSAASRPWYVLLKPYEMVQFPWRFLGVVTLFMAAGGGGFVCAITERRRVFGPVAAAAVAAAAVLLSVPHRRVMLEVPMEDETATLDARVAADLFSAKFGNSDEYLPKDAGIDAANSTPALPAPRGIGVEVGAVRAGGTEVTFDVTAQAGEGIAVVPWHFFPGWRATLDGRAWPLKPGPDGLIALWVPEGRHVARVRFGTTPPRVVGWLLAIAGLAALAGLAVRERGWR